MKFSPNVGSVDKIVRIVLGVVLALVAFFVPMAGWLAIVLFIAAALMFVTAFLNFCPVYLPFKINTREK
ncbi:MAG TPA: DUF2892 domain-containing protein [Anaerolineales bacterium]|nr:DUF2892 domain-containing protein [Anaerolineales bacterium]